MRVLYATRPYEAEPGSANALHEKWKKRCGASRSKRSSSMMEFGRNIRGIIRDFDALPLRDVRKPRVGIVGEILVKFSPLANNHIVELLEDVYKRQSRVITKKMIKLARDSRISSRVPRLWDVTNSRRNPAPSKMASHFARIAITK